MKPSIHIGTSAYNNFPWNGVFYPEDIPRSKWFEYYCRHFDTFEINSSFYKFPTAKSLNGWHKKSPENFVFAVKASKLITHYRRFNDCERQIGEFYEASANGLLEKLGPVLFQFPPSFKYEPEKLDLVISQLDRNFRNVLEFRHESWWIPEVFSTLRSNNVTFCSVSYPKLPEDFISTNSIGYVRLHGVPKLFYSEYGKELLSELAGKITSADDVSDVFVFFNNTASIAGINDALLFRDQQMPNVIKV